MARNGAELFLHGQGPFDMQKATIAILGGYVFPKPAWSLRWRTWLLRQFVHINRHIPMVRRRERFSLLKTTPVCLPARESALASV